MVLQGQLIIHLGKIGTSNIAIALQNYSEMTVQMFMRCIAQVELHAGPLFCTVQWSFCSLETYFLRRPAAFKMLCLSIEEAGVMSYLEAMLSSLLYFRRFLLTFIWKPVIQTLHYVGLLAQVHKLIPEQPWGEGEIQAFNKTMGRRCFSLKGKGSPALSLKATIGDISSKGLKKKNTEGTKH